MTQKKNPEFDDLEPIAEPSPRPPVQKSGAFDELEPLEPAPTKPSAPVAPGLPSARGAPPPASKPAPKAPPSKAPAPHTPAAPPSRAAAPAPKPPSKPAAAPSGPMSAPPRTPAGPPPPAGAGEIAAAALDLASAAQPPSSAPGAATSSQAAAPSGPGAAAPIVPAPGAPGAAAARASARERGRRGSKKEEADAPPRPPREKPGTQSRPLEQAPKLLGVAAKILLAGSLLPWVRPEVIESGLWGSLGAKALILLGAYVFHQGLRAAYGDTAPGFALALDKKIIPRSPRGFGWSAGEFLGLAILLAGLMPVVDAASFPAGSGFFYSFAVGAYSDKGMLTLACLTLSHIYAYTKGAHFSPLFPIMFLGPAVAGVTSVFGGATALAKGSSSIGTPGLVLCILGAALGSAAGILAVYTIVVALKQAKVEGDAKRAAQVEARKLSRGRRPS